MNKKQIILLLLITIVVYFSFILSGISAERRLPQESEAPWITNPDLIRIPDTMLDEPIVPRDPEAPWRGDPDLSSITDNKLVKLWKDTVVVYRYSEIPKSGSVNSLHDAKEYTSIPKSKQDQEYLINSLTQQLNTNPIDWNCVRVILILMYAGMEPDPRIPVLGEQLFKMPRPMKMSDDQGWAYRSMLQLLLLQPSVEAAQLVAAAVDREFWGDDPFHTTALVRDDTEMSILNMRLYALKGLRLKMPPEISIPVLQEITDRYLATDMSQEDREFVFNINKTATWIENKKNQNNK